MAKKRDSNQSILDNPWTDDDVKAYASFVEEERNRPAPRPDFSDVVGGSSLDRPQREPNLIDRYFALQQSAQDAAIGGLQRTAGAAGFATADDAVLPNIYGWLATKLVPDDVKERGKEFYGDLLRHGSENAQSSENARKFAGLPTPLDKAARGVNDVLSSPSSLGSIPGGPFAAIPAYDVFAQEYAAGIQGGLSKDEAKARAEAMAGVEAGISAIPAGKFLDKVGLGGGARTFLRGQVSGVVGGTLKTAAGEAAEEGITESAQAGLDALLAAKGPTEGLKKFSATQAPKTAGELWDRVERATIAGATGGATFGGVHATMEDAAKAGALAADVNTKYKSYLDIAEAEAKRKAPPTVKPRVRVKLEEKLEQAKTDAEVESPEAADEIDGMLAGLRSEQMPTQGNGGATARSVLQEMTSKINEGGARQLATRLQRGDVVLVQSDTHIPNKQARGSAGFYDGKRTYIVADKIDPSKPMLGQVMDVLAHETTHVGDVSGNIASKLVGDKNNARLSKMIMETARKQAGNDDFINVDPRSPEFAQLTPEQKATVFAIQNTDNSGAGNLETVAYYVNFARAAAQERAAKKATSAVWQNVKSAVKDTFGINPSLNDVAYLSDKLLLEAANTNKPLTGDVDATVQRYGGTEGTTGLNMIGGEKATGFNEARTYTGAVDLKQRFEFDDSKSTITNDDFTIQDILDGNPAPLNEVLNHEELYKQYPGIGNEIKVKVDKTLDDKTYGYMDARTGTIGVNPDVLKGNKQRLRKLILHEVQHVIQAKEGFIRGANPIALRDPNVVREFETQGARLAEVPSNFEIGIAQRTLPTEARARWDALLNEVEAESGELTPDEKSALFLDEGFGEQSTNRLVQGLQNQYNRAKESFFKSSEEFEGDKYTARDLYNRDYGETEARNTEFRADMPADTRNRFEPEATMQYAEGQVPVNKTINAKEFAKSKSLGLAMSAEAVGFDRGTVNLNEDKASTNKVLRAAERLLVPDGYLDKQLTELLRHATSLPASMAQRGMYLNNKFREAVDANVAKSNGKYTDESFRKLLSARIDAIDKLETVELRESAVAALDREFPGIGKALNELRQYKLGLTREILALRKRDPKKLTEKERNIYKKMVSNAERYTTRAYLATYDREIGNTYGKQMIEKFKNDPKSEQGKIVQEALDYLVKKELTLPDHDFLENKATTEQIRRIHEAWVGPTTGFKGDEGRKQMIQNLENMPAKTKAEINAKAWEIVQEMLGQIEEKSGIAREFTPSMRQNRTILEARSDIPPQLRKLLGEITDPLLREAISLNRMINLSTKTKFLTEAYEKGKGKWWNETKDGQFQIKLDSAAYGPLDGKYVTQDMSDAITGTVMNLRGMDEALSEVAQNGDLLMKVLAGKAFPLMKEIMSAQKTYGVVADMYNMFVNLVGAVVLMGPLNGLVPLGKTSWKGMEGAAKTLLLDVWNRKVSEENSKLVEELLLAGVTDSATMGEFKGHAYDEIKKQLSKMGGAKLTPAKVFSTAFKVAMGKHKVGDAIRTAYAFMDVWVKVATYYDRKAYNTKLNKYENLGLSEEDIIRKSGFEASGTNISYERAVPLAKILEKNIPLFLFLTYKTEVVRATAASVLRGLADLHTATQAKTPAGKMLAASQGIKRLTGTTAVLSLLIGETLNLLNNEDDDEKKKRFLDFDWMRNAIMYKLGLNEDGNEVMLNISRFDPLGPMTELITTIAKHPDGQFTETSVKALGDFFFAESKGVFSVFNLARDALVSGAASAVGDESLREYMSDMKRKGIVERNYPEVYKQLQKIPGNIGVNSAEVFERLFLPAQLKAVIDKRGKTDNAFGELVRLSGASLYVRDPDKALTGKVIEHDKAVKSLKKQRDEAFKAGNLDQEKLKDLVDKEYQSFTRLSNGLDGYLAFDNTTVAGANQIIENKKLAAQLRRGTFKSQLIDTKVLEDWRKRELKKKGADRREIQEQYRELKALYSEVE